MKKHFMIHGLCSLLFPFSICALPQGFEVAQGEADFHLNSDSFFVTAADKTIINYESFNVAKQEVVRFIQPSKQSGVLNRVIGSEPSRLLGKISSNGKVFLVNPNGVYFSRDAIVDMGSLIVSTLDILDQDFLEDRFSFQKKEGIVSGSIYNEGTLISSEGSIALLSPHIKNEGVIRATRSKILLAGAEAATLTFSCDGLISFEVGEGMEEGFIEHLGSIEANEVFIRLASAKAAMENVINTEGLPEGNTITRENGKIRIVHESSIKANKAFIEGSKVSLEGEVDVSGETIGGTLHILGDHLQLTGATIDASGNLGGGTVLIGGEYQGRKDVRSALTNIMDENTVIKANALTKGNGGRIILWADGATLFNGKIFAQGGGFAGDGGFVETSGKKSLSVKTGHVNTLAPFGKAGEWLLDPLTITIASTGSGTLVQASNCSDTSSNITITPAVINAAASNVILCASLSITQNGYQGIAMTNGNVGITFQGQGGTIATELNSSITTQSGVVAFASTTVTLGAGVSIDTTNAGGSAGANITFDAAATVNGDQTLTLTAGEGAVSFGAGIGAMNPLTGLTVSAATVTQGFTAQMAGALSYAGSSAINVEGNITTGGGTITMTGPVSLANAPTFDTTNNRAEVFGANISFTGTLDGATALTLQAGDAGVITFTGDVGKSVPLTNITFTSGGLIQIGANLKVTGANPLNFSEAVSIIGTSIITSNNANITFNETLDGSRSLTLAGGTGTLTFSEAVGGNNPLTSLAATSSIITQNSSITSLGALTYTNTGLLTIDGSISAGSFTQSGGGNVLLGASINASSGIYFTDPITFNASLSLTASGTGGIVLNAPMIPVLNGAYSLTFFAPAGTITGPQLGSSSEYINVLTLTAKGLGITSIYANNIIENGSETISSDITAPGAYLLFSNPTTVSAGVFTIDVTGGTAVGGITFASTLDGPGSLAFNVGGGNLNFDGNIGSITAFGDLAIAGAQNVLVAGSFTGSSFTQVAGGGTTTISGIMTTSSSTGISLTGTIMYITGPIITTGAGPVTFDHAGLLTLSNTINANGPVSQTGGGTVELGGDITTTNTVASSAIISFTNPVTLTADVVINTIIGEGNITFGSLATIDGLKDLSLIAGTGNVSLGAEIGGLTPIDALTIYSADNLTLPAITASSLLQVAGTGTTILGGTVTTIGDAGIVIVGNIVNVNAPIETLGKGPIILQNSGLLTISAGAAINAAGVFLQVGSGNINVSGNVTAH